MSRKYKQSGYQDEGGYREGGAARKRGAATPREDREGPRGRGLGAPTATVFRCARCGRRQEGAAPAGDAVCSGCGADLHTCTHCAHFDTSSSFECRREIPQRVAKKDQRNECELFEVKLTQEFAAEAESPRDGRAAFDDLFNF